MEITINPVEKTIKISGNPTYQEFTEFMESHFKGNWWKYYRISSSVQVITTDPYPFSPWKVPEITCNDTEN